MSKNKFLLKSFITGKIKIVHKSYKRTIYINISIR